MCILDGNAYDAKCLEAGQERDEDLDACSLLVNNKMQPLLSPSGAASHSPQSKVVVQLTVSHCLSLYPYSNHCIAGKVPVPECCKQHCVPQPWRHFSLSSLSNAECENGSCHTCQSLAVICMLQECMRPLQKLVLICTAQVVR